MWEGENGFFAQDIAKEKITILGEDAPGLAIASAGQIKMYFAPDKRKRGMLCYQYDLTENRKEKIVNEDARGCITNYLKEKDIRDIVLKKFLNNGSEVFFEVKVVTNREKFNVVLKKESNKFVVDTQLSYILQTKKNIELVDCFQSKWFFEGEQIYCYDSKNNEYKEISDNSKEMNIYRVLEEGS